MTLSAQVFRYIRELKQFVAVLANLNSNGLYRSSGNEKGSSSRLLTSSTKREIKHFYVVVVQIRQRDVQKSVMHVQSCRLLNKPIAFLPFSLPSPSPLLELPIKELTQIPERSRGR